VAFIKTAPKNSGTRLSSLDTCATLDFGSAYLAPAVLAVRCVCDYWGMSNEDTIEEKTSVGSMCNRSADIIFFCDKILSINSVSPKKRGEEGLCRYNLE